MWSEKVFKLDREKPSWQDFKKDYGRSVPKRRHEGRPIDGEDSSKCLQKMGNALSVVCGWQIQELKALPQKAWVLRTEVVRAQEGTGVASESFE